MGQFRATSIDRTLAYLGGRPAPVCPARFDEEKVATVLGNSRGRPKEFTYSRPVSEKSRRRAEAARRRWERERRMSSGTDTPEGESFDIWRRAAEIRRRLGDGVV
jgi:hypothetical protein